MPKTRDHGDGMQDEEAEQEPADRVPQRGHPANPPGQRRRNGRHDPILAELDLEQFLVPRAETAHP
jgi:hypothetical protein